MAAGQGEFARGGGDSTWKPGSTEPPSSGRGPDAAVSAQPTIRAKREAAPEETVASTTRSRDAQAALAAVALDDERVLVHVRQSFAGSAHAVDAICEFGGGGSRLVGG